MTHNRKGRWIGAAAAAALTVPLTGCVTVNPPDRPIELNVNVDIRQEVLVRLQQDVQQIIRENPDAFPSTPPGGRP